MNSLIKTNLFLDLIGHIFIFGMAAIMLLAIFLVTAQPNLLLMPVIGDVASITPVS